MTTVLIADDERPMRLLVATTLEPLGYDILEASDGEQAWDLLRRHGPDLAILDVAMPGRDGLQLARAIRDDPELADMRVVLLSARAQQANIEFGLLAGADLYLTKPFSPQELQRAIARVMAQEPGAGQGGPP